MFRPAHCLHTVTEDNAELLCSVNTAVLGVLENVLLSSQTGMAHTLLRTLAAGTICHLSCFFQNKLLKNRNLLPLHKLKVAFKRPSVDRSRLWIEETNTTVDKYRDCNVLVPLPELCLLVTQGHCGTRRAACLLPVRPRPSAPWWPPCRGAWTWTRAH